MVIRRGNNDHTLTDWLEQEFTNKHTRDNYASSIRKFKEALEITDLGKYLESDPDVASELKRFSISLAGRPSKTISTYMSSVKLFFQDHGFEISINEWEKTEKTLNNFFGDSLWKIVKKLMIY